MVHRRYQPAWLLDSGKADAVLWQACEDGRVRCQLCPRECSIRPGSAGFCRARFNDGGALKTLIWGKLLIPSVEPIETEAVFHYWPGEKILSIGNLGCNLRCDFCQNWESSDIINLSEEHVISMQPDQIVALARELGIRVISFTYNDPVIWLEFVLETAELARREGLLTLFKSASYISEYAASVLTQVIDVFSISLKTINPSTFRRISQGELEPVLRSLRTYHRSGRHLEISNLIVTGLTDVEDEIRELSRWIRDELADNVPLHLVRFHPSYRYRDCERTPIAFLERSREIALEEGLRYVYIGNTYVPGHADIHCPECRGLVVRRFGLTSSTVGLTRDGRCAACGSPQEIEPAPGDSSRKVSGRLSPQRSLLWQWTNEDARLIHLKITNRSPSSSSVCCLHLDRESQEIGREMMSIPGNARIRIAIGQPEVAACSLELLHREEVECQIVELQDRAHFPLEAAV